MELYLFYAWQHHQPRTSTAPLRAICGLGKLAIFALYLLFVYASTIYHETIQRRSGQSVGWQARRSWRWMYRLCDMSVARDEVQRARGRLVGRGMLRSWRCFVRLAQRETSNHQSRNDACDRLLNSSAGAPERNIIAQVRVCAESLVSQYQWQVAERSSIRARCVDRM